MNNVTDKTHGLVQRWIGARKSVERIKRDLTAAECEQANAINELGKWLVPEGQNNEPFNIWFGSGILQATRSPNGGYAIAWRKEPDGKDRLEFGI